MCKQKTISRAIILATTLSLGVISACQTPVSNVVETKKETPIPSVSSTLNTQSSAQPEKTPNPQSYGWGDETSRLPSDIKELATMNGKVYDTSGVLVDGAKVTAKSIDASSPWTAQDQLSANGTYVFRNVPVGARVEITATKDGWTKRLRTEVLKSNLTGNPDSNKYDFGGPTDPSNIYAIQDEPEVTSLKINGKQALDSDINHTLNPNPRVPENLSGANLTGIPSDSLTVEMSFSEPVRQDDVENYFRVTSQNIFTNNSASRFTIDKNLAGTKFEWAKDGTYVTFTTNKAILANSFGDEARYMIDFSQAFRDKTDKQAKAQNYFKFNAKSSNDFHVFSVANQSIDPILVSISARDGGSGNDLLDLTFNKAMDVINQSVPQALLADPKQSNIKENQMWLVNTNNSALGSASIGSGNSLTNDVSLLGYFTGVAPVGTTGNPANFKPVYAIGRLKSVDINNPTTLAPIGQNIGGTSAVAFIANVNRNPADTITDISNLYATTLTNNATPSQSFSAYKTLKLSPLGCGSNTAVTQDINTAGIKSVKVNGKVITLELAPNAFDKNDRVIVAVGGNITGKYEDKSNSINRNDLTADLFLGGTAGNVIPSFASFIDPSSRTISVANAATSGNLKITDNQKISIAN